MVPLFIIISQLIPLALKIDAIPGRLNVAGLLINRVGTFYGQCSELCGVLHGFMPIVTRAVSLPSFYSYFKLQVIGMLIVVLIVCWVPWSDYGRFIWFKLLFSLRIAA
jgi:Cytochrome C oxidase subunit II, periplasmic domain